MIDAKTKLCCILGRPVEHSLSPLMHNAAYKKLNLNYVFVAFNIKSVKKALYGLKALGAKGIVVTIPHKLEVLKYVDEIDKSAKIIGAANTIINKNNKLIAKNTDWIGALKAIEEKTELKNKKIALLGAGGAARAIIYALKMKKAKIDIFNRTLKRAKALVEEFKLNKAYLISEEEKIAKADIIINATSVGMEPEINKSPISISCIQKRHVVFDIVYTPLKTKLIKLAQKKGAKVVYGDKMVLYGGVEQFELFTGIKAPVEVMKQALNKNIA